MNVLFYTILFVIGIVIGSLWAIQAYKIPKSLDMKKTHYSDYSHAELVSRLTYILLGGMISVVLANILELNIYEIDLFKIIIYVFAMLYITTLVLVGGIDRVVTAAGIIKDSYQTTVVRTEDALRNSCIFTAFSSIAISG